MDSWAEKTGREDITDLITLEEDMSNSSITDIAVDVGSLDLCPPDLAALCTTKLRVSE